MRSEGETPLVENSGFVLTVLFFEISFVSQGSGAMVAECRMLDHARSNGSWIGSGILSPVERSVPVR